MSRIPAPAGKQNEQFRQLVESIIDYAILGLDRSGAVTSWNAGAECVFGYGAHEIVGQHYETFFTPEDRAAGRPARDLVTALTAGRFEDEGWRIRKDGARLWASVVIDPILNDTGECTGFAEVIRDMSEQRIAQEALRQSEERFRLLMESVVDYAVFTLDPAGRVTSWNAGAQRAKGYSRAEILGQHYAIFFTPEDQRQGKPENILRIAQGVGRYEEEGWRVRKDGSRFWASIVITALHDHAGAFAGFAKVTRDMSERRALEAAREQLHQVQKMETVGQLTGGVAHDFNNLLAAVIGSLELVGKLNVDPNVRRLVGTALRAAERGAKLTHQLLAFSRRQALQPRTSDVNQLISAFEMLLRRAISDSIALHLDLLPALWLSDVDPAQFQSALLNLVVNARDAMPNGGVLSITTGNVALDPEAARQLSEIAPGAYISVIVRDTGVGMAAEVKRRAIEPFYTTKDIGQGSGLGLSQVYGFVRQSDGQMAIESEPGQGTAIRLYLPKSQAVTVQDAENRAADARRNRGVVLVVEDDPDVLEIAIEAVRSFGYTVRPARDAAEALSILRAPPPVDLLFTDVMMPNGMNGVELARTARELQPAIRVLLASGYPREALYEREGMSRNAAFIAKPYTLAALSERLRSLSQETAH